MGGTGKILKNRKFNRECMRILRWTGIDPTQILIHSLLNVQGIFRFQKPQLNLLPKNNSVTVFDFNPLNFRYNTNFELFFQLLEFTECLDQVFSLLVTRGKGLYALF